VAAHIFEGETPSALQRQLFSSLRKWANGYHVGAPWVLDAALDTLHDWLTTTRRKLIWIYPSELEAPLVTENETYFHLRHYGWDVRSETRVDFEKAVRAAFEAYLEHYLAEIAQKATRMGWKRTSEWRVRNDRDPGERFEWLVRWQVQGWTKNAIANHYKIGHQRRAGKRLGKEGAKAGVSTLQNALIATSKEIALPLRVGRPGRKPARNC
jgi:hypothetical protein